MKNKMLPILRIFAIVIVLVWSFQLHAGSGKVTVTHAPDSISTLKAKWAWALESATNTKANKGFYIGFSIRRMMGVNSFIGHWSSHRSEGEKTLNEIIYGVKIAGPDSYWNKSVGETARIVLHRAKDKHKPEKKVAKDVAVLFRLRSPGSSFQEIEVSNLSMTAHLEDGPLFWLGPAKNAESIPLLEDFYRREKDTDNKEDLLRAVAIHDDKARVFPFLKGVLTGNEPADLREDAAFWIGESQIPEAAKLLKNTALNDRSEDVREKAVFALYIHRSGEADDGLIYLAKNGKERNIRKKAIFWLGQKAVKRSAEILKDVVDNDKDTAVQKAAIFALSQLSGNKGVTSLIKIAKTHTSLAVRKKAIFWLSQSDDPRALDTIIDLIEK
jgi:hypothetical protein